MASLRRISYYWRNIGTVISFAVFGGGALMLSVIIIPVFVLFARQRERRRMIAQRCICYSFKFFVGMMRGLGVIDCRIENAEKLQEDAGCLIVANHPSLIDYVILTSLMPRCDCVVKESLWNNLFMRGVIRAADYIPNHDAESVLVACKQKFVEGGKILVFPEGTRTALGRPISLRRGAANIAVRCQADLRVVHITCNPPILSKEQRWWQSAVTRPLFVIQVREKIHIDQFLKKSSFPAHAARMLNEHLVQALDPALAGKNPHSNESARV